MRHRYTINDFHRDFPNQQACLDYIFKRKYPKLFSSYYPIHGRNNYANKKGHQINPLKGTIFYDTRLPLTTWFYAIFLFSVSKQGVSAAELERQLGITKNAAWRMGQKIRSLMKQNTGLLSGIVEADETYLGRRDRKIKKKHTKAVIIGALQRNGEVRAKVVSNRSEATIAPFLEKTVRKGTRLMTDEAPVYKTVRHRYRHKTVNHSQWEWGRGDVYTSSLEGFWGSLKRGLRGTHISVSKQHLQSYVDERIFFYNHRREPMFETILARV